MFQHKLKKGKVKVSRIMKMIKKGKEINETDNINNKENQ